MNDHLNTLLKNVFLHQKELLLPMLPHAKAILYALLKNILNHPDTRYVIWEQWYSVSRLFHVGELKIGTCTVDPHYSVLEACLEATYWQRFVEKHVVEDEDAESFYALSYFFKNYPHFLEMIGGHATIYVYMKDGQMIIEKLDTKTNQIIEQEKI
jgi:hypothetical protein